MGEAELKAALQREADARISALWQAAEERVATRRREVEADSTRLDAEAEQQRLAAVNQVRQEVLAKARQEAADARLQAESVMDGRLLETDGLGAGVSRLYDKDFDGSPADLPLAA